MILSYKEFNKKRILILESRFKETYWFRITFNDVLNLIETNELKTEGSLFLVTKDSENYESYEDEFLFPITLFLDKEKTLDFLKKNNYKTSISKKNDFFKESEDVEDFSELGNTPEDPSAIETNSEDENVSDEEPTDEEIPEEETTEELPDEITVNEKVIKLDPDIIIGMEIFLKKLENLLDNEFNKLLTQLKIKNKSSNSNDIDKRNKIQDLIISKIDTYCTSNNIIKNYIKD